MSIRTKWNDWKQKQAFHVEKKKKEKACPLSLITILSNYSLSLITTLIIADKKQVQKHLQ